MDFDPAQRKLVYDHIMEEFGHEYTAFILAIGTIDDKGVIDEISRAMEIDAEPIKNDYASDPEKAKAKYPEVFYYFDGLKGCAISQSMHPAGIVVSPITLMDNYGYFHNENGDRVMYINMEEIHEVSLVKYDILGLKQIAVLRNICEMINQKYPQSHEVDWNDEYVWNDIAASPIGIFQFESDYSFKLLQRYKPRSIYDLTMLTAALRPAGESYREQWIQRIPNQNPSKQIDEILADNNGYLIFQEDVLKFLQEVCGLPGSEADNVRRAIGRKQLDRLQAALPSILEGYCSKSEKPRAEAEKEAVSFLKIIEDASSYMFNYNHAIAYSMISYLCAYYRYYHPMEFICAYLNNAQNDDDITGGTTLAETKGIKILPPTFGGSGALYTCDYKRNSIYKGVASIKSLNISAAENLKAISESDYSSFTDLLYAIKETKACNMGQLKALIKINYFRAFGGNQKLLNICEIFEELHDKKTIKKGRESELGLTAEFLTANCEKVTTAQYNNCDMKKIILKTEANTENTSIGIIDQLEAELKYLGYIQSRYNVALDYYYVLDINTKYSPILYLYNLAEGNTLRIKTRKNKVFNIKTGEQYTYAGDIISVVSIVSENRKRLVDGEWQELDEKEDILKSYALVKKGNRCLPEKKKKN